jgi:hypothetical protein
MSELDWGDLARRPKAIQSTAEGHLLTAIILRAVTDARQPVPDNDALTWLFSDRALPLDVVWVCDVLDMSIEKIRNCVRESLQAIPDRAHQNKMFRSMFSRVPAPFTLDQAQQTLKPFWPPGLVKDFFTVAIGMGVLSEEPEERNYYAITPLPKEEKWTRSTHKKTESARSAGSPEGAPATTPSAQKLGKQSTPMTNTDHPRRPTSIATTA